jgi:hypothetical protein
MNQPTTIAPSQQPRRRRRLRRRRRRTKCRRGRASRISKKRRNGLRVGTRIRRRKVGMTRRRVCRSVQVDTLELVESSAERERREAGL